MKILWLINHFPYPPNRGDKIRDYHLIGIIAKDNIVDLVALRKKDDPSYEDLMAHTPLRQTFFKNVSRKQELLIRLISSVLLFPSQCGLLVAKGMKKLIKEAEKTHRYDVIITSKFYFASVVPRKLLHKTVIDNHGIEYVYYHSLIRETKNIMVKAFYFMDSISIRIIEKRYLTRAAKCVFLSVQDYMYARQSYDVCTPHAICPQGITRERIPSAKQLDFENRDIDLIFVGNLTQSRNFDPLHSFLIYLSRSREAGDIKIAIVGKGAPEKLRRLCVGNVKYYGYVDDLDSLLLRSKYMFCYLPGGSGVKTKIIEGVVFGMKVICDKHSAGALPELVGNGAIVVHSYRDIVAEINKERDNWESHIGVKIIEDGLTWDSIAKKYLDFISS